MKLRTLLTLVLLVLGICAPAVAQASTASTIDQQTYLSAFAPDTPHVAPPHGVIPTWDWATHSVLHRLSPPSTESTSLNLWGQIYVDETDVHPANTRVAVAGCQLWGLTKATNRWTLIQDTPLGRLLGANGWAEDFQAHNGPMSSRLEPDGSTSFVPSPGWNVHFWSGRLVDVGWRYKAFVSACSARLVLDNPARPDDRPTARYMLSIGSDWKPADGSCPTTKAGVHKCTGMGVGRFAYVRGHWKRVLNSTMTPAQAATYPPLPLTALRNPGGSYGNAWVR